MRLEPEGTDTRLKPAAAISIDVDNDEFIARWIAFHTRYVVEGEIACNWNHYNTIDPAQHGSRMVPYQPIHRKREDPAERDQLVRLSLSAPQEAWQLILGILAATDDAMVLGYLAAPVELLLARNGTAYIDAVVELARQDPGFRTIVLGLRTTSWPGDLPQDIRSRLAAI